MFYFHLSTFRLLLQNSKFRWIPTILGLVQNLVIPSILVWVLNAFSTNSTPSTWTHRILITPWDWTLTRSTPLFTLIEGFASLLVIQAVGQICRWVVNIRSD